MPYCRHGRPLHTGEHLITAGHPSNRYYTAAACKDHLAEATAAARQATMGAPVLIDGVPAAEPPEQQPRLF